MKKIILFFLFLSAFSVAYLFFSSNSNDNSPPSDKTKFVSINDGKFSLNGAPFYPLTINYIVGLQADKGELWPCPSIAYNSIGRFRYVTKDSCLMQLKADMDLIKEMGFNSVRFVGIGEEVIDEPQGGRIGVRLNNGNRSDSTAILWSESSYKKYFDAIQKLLDVANSSGLKVILLLRMSVDEKATEVHMKKLIHRFRNDTAILAYDFFNEPLYFDGIERNKKVIYETLKRWHSIAKKSSPNQLVTVGLTGIREVFEWDPNILDVDFISLHPYEYEPEQVRNEMYWYGNYIKKPWIIGETAISADNDSVSYDDQSAFARKTIKQAFNCGAVGYSWWQYKDVEWHNYHANFMGVINWKGETKTKNENITIEGTPKPLIEEFKKFDPRAPKDSCICLSNYYNYSQHKTCRIIGYLKDENNKPIQGGVVLAWNQYWSHSYHTVTKEDGSFELLGDFPFYHWMASASVYSMVRGDLQPDTARRYIDTILTMNLGNIGIEKLSFLN